MQPSSESCDEVRIYIVTLQVVSGITHNSLAVCSLSLDRLLTHTQLSNASAEQFIGNT